MGALAGACRAADPLIEINRPNTVGLQLAQQELDHLLRKKLPGQPEANIAQAKRDFSDHLRTTDPIVAENFSAGRMSEDDLASRLDVFISDHPEYAGHPNLAPKTDSRARVSQLLKDAPSVNGDGSRRSAFVDRFVGQLSGTALESFNSGKMSDDEIQSRVSVFVGDLQAEAVRSAADPALAAALPIIDAYLKANFGSATDRVESLCYRGTVEEGSKVRHFVIFKRRPNMIRIHIVDGDIVIGVLGYDGKTAWSETYGKPAIELGGPQAEQISNAAAFDDPLQDYQAHGAVVRLVSRPAEVPIQLQIVDPDGTEMISTLDPSTHRQLSLRTKRPGKAWNEMRFSDYRKVGAVNFAFRQEEWGEGGLRSTTKIDEVALDPGLIEPFFARPTTTAISFMDLMGGLAEIEARQKSKAAISVPSAGAN
jgi:hypothetical protein